MKTRNTLILVLVAALLFLGIRWYESRNPGMRQGGANRQVLRFDREAIEGISLTRGDEVIELKKKGRRWEIASPIADRADGAMIEQLLTELEFLRAGEVIEIQGENAKQRAKEFGVNRPKLRVKLHGKDAPEELGIGKETAVSGRVYARVDNEPKVHVISDTVKNLVIRKAEAFRAKQLSDLDVGEVGKVVIKRNDGEVVLERPEARWRITKPLRSRADDQKVADLIARWVTLPIREFGGAADKAMAVHGFEEPRATLSLYVDSASEPALFEIGSPVPGRSDAVFVRYADRGGFYVVPSAPVDELLKLEPNDLRDRQLLRLQMDVVDRIRIRPAGKPEMILARRGEEWVLLQNEVGRPADQAAVERMVTALQQRKIERFEPETAEPSSGGTSEPKLEVVFSSFASENTPESNAGERPFLHLQLGEAQGGLVPARVQEEGVTVMVGADLLESIPTHSSEWQTPELFRFEPQAVQGLKIARKNSQNIAIARESGDAWRIEEGAGVLDGIATQSLLNTLASLRAVRWVGPEEPSHGLSDPPMRLEYRLADGGRGEIRIGGSGPDGTRFAAVAGMDGVAVLSGPDVSALEAELLKTPLPTPPASKGGASPAPSGAARDPKE